MIPVLVTKEMVEGTLALEPCISPFVFREPHQCIKCNVPVITRYPSDQRTYTKSLSDFKSLIETKCFEKFKTMTPMHKFFNNLFKTYNEDCQIVLAGGAVATLVTGNERDEIKDYDFFVIAPNAEVAKDEVVHLCEKISRIPVDKVKANRTKNAITFELVSDHHTIVFQVILVTAPNVLDIVKNFDVGSSQLYYDGENVYTTQLGQLAHDYSMNILNMKVRRSSYEYRFIKYFYRGYDLCLPNLKVKPLKYEYQLKKVHFQVIDHSIDNDTLLYQVEFLGHYLDRNGLYGQEKNDKLTSNVFCLTAAVKKSLNDGIFTIWDSKNLSLSEWLNDETTSFVIDIRTVKRITSIGTRRNVLKRLVKYVGPEYAVKVVNEMVNDLPIEELHQKLIDMFKDVEPIKFPFKMYDQTTITPYEVMTEKEYYGKFYSDNADLN